MTRTDQLLTNLIAAKCDIEAFMNAKLSTATDPHARTMYQILRDGAKIDADVLNGILSIHRKEQPNADAS